MNKRHRFRALGRRSNLWVVSSMLLPAVLALFLLRLLPGLFALRDSLFKTSLVGGGTTWVGLTNYQALFGDGAFWNTMRVTMIFVLIINPLQIVFALALAVLLSQRLPGQSVWRALVFAPAAVPMAVSSIIWGVGYQPDGPLNAILKSLGASPQRFLTSPNQALWSIIILLSWVGVGYWMVFLIAGLQEIPNSYYDAASVDGASWWRTFFSITLPLLRRQLAFVLVADTVGNFLVFAPIQILTNGGPMGSTNLIMYHIYDKAYQNGNINAADAEVTLLIIVMAIIVAVQFRLLKEKS